MFAVAPEEIAAVVGLDLVSPLRTVQDEPVDFGKAPEDVAGAGGPVKPLLGVADATGSALSPVVKVDAEAALLCGRDGGLEDLQSGGVDPGHLGRLCLTRGIQFRVGRVGRFAIQHQVSQDDGADTGLLKAIQDDVRTFRFEGVDPAHEHPDVEAHC